MDVVRNFCAGMVSVLQITSAPLLYRYPYRTTAEAMYADWQRIAGDIESVIGTITRESNYGRE